MATTLDHISGGRAILGIGAAWFEEEHEAFGLEFGSGPPERLRWLGEALPIMRGMLDGTEPTATRPALPSRRTPATCRRRPGPPADLHRRRRREGHAQARRAYADMNNVGGGIEKRPAQGADPAPALRDRRPRPGRDRADDAASARSSSATTGPRPSASSARRSTATASPRHWNDQPVGHARGRREKLAPYLDARLSAPDRRLSRRLRRGVDDPLRDRGPAAARARLSLR